MSTGESETNAGEQWTELNAGTAPVRQQHRFDEASLEDWCRSNIAGFSGPLTVNQFKGGQSNPTYQLSTPGKSYVLRRKPPGSLIKSAHAVDREFRVISALHATGFPVPRTYALCIDEAVIGSWFYVMDMVEGRIFWDAAFSNVPLEARADYFCAMNDTIARLHSLDHTAVGLSDYGNAGNYFERQIARFTKQYLGDEIAGRYGSMDKLVEWLPANIPPNEEIRIVHGDFRVDNMIFHPSEAKVIAVLDWELSTLGHPLADFAFHAMMYRMPPELMAGLVGIDLAAMKIPSEEAYIRQYCVSTGRNGIEDYDFYVAFNMFRLAAIVYGLKGRYLRGTAASSHAADSAARFEPLADLAWEQAQIAIAAKRG